MGRYGSAFLWSALALAGLLVFVMLNDKASPHASVDLKVSKAEANIIAQEYLEGRGLSLDGYSSAIRFESANLSAAYLQRTLGMERANELMRSRVAIWFWTARWFQPLQKEELVVQVSPAGEVLFFRHLLEEEREGEELEQEAARHIAEEFTSTLPDVNLEEYELVEASTEERKARIDHKFTWKRKEFSVEDAELRLGVWVQGNEVGGFFNKAMKVPEDFRRSQDREECLGQLLTLISFALTFLLAIAALVVFMFRFRAHDVRWRFPLVFAGAFAAMAILEGLNRHSPYQTGGVQRTHNPLR